MRALFLLLILTCCSLEAAAERIYFDLQEMPMDGEDLRVHVGENVWIRTKAIHSDNTGIFTYASNVYTLPGSVEYEKKWKCPYCNRWWPMHTPCQNQDCPSKYRG